MDFSDLSDLTELSSDEEDQSTKSGKPKPKPKKTGYVLQNVLRPPRQAQYSAKWLYEQIVDNQIDLNPEYQREIVWPETKQSGLIDSLLHNFYIPPIIFSVTSQSDGSEMRTCIDGKQRLTSIQRFFDGMICHKDSYTNQKLWYKGGSSANRKLLPQQYKNSFASKQITCFEFENLTEDQEREMFQRVQLGVALTPAERLQAITGPFPSLIREIQGMIASDNGFDNHMDWATTRGRDFQSIASIVYLVHRIPSQSFPAAAALDKWLQTGADVDSALRSAVIDTFKRYIALVRNPKTNKPFTKPTRVSPVEFVMIGLLVFILRTKCDDVELSKCIQDMRTDVRAKHDDIRSNTKVTKTMFLFINNSVKGRGNTNTPNIKPQIAGKKGKRKRGDGSDDEGDETYGGPSKPPANRTRAAAASAIKAQPAAKPAAPRTNNKSPAKAATHKLPDKPPAPPPSAARNPPAPAPARNPPTPTHSRYQAAPTSKRDPPIKKEQIPTQLSSLPAIRNSRAQDRASSPTEAPKPVPQPPVSTQSSSRPSPPVFIKTEPTDFFAALRQARASEGSGTAPIVLPADSPTRPLTAPRAPHLTRQYSSLPTINTNMTNGHTATSTNGSHPPPQSRPDIVPLSGQPTLSSENIMMLRNLSMMGALKSPADISQQMTTHTPAASGGGGGPNTYRPPLPPPPPSNSGSYMQQQQPPVPQYSPPPVPSVPPEHGLPRRPSAETCHSNAQPRYNDNYRNDSRYPGSSYNNSSRSRDPRPSYYRDRDRDRDRNWR